MSGANPRYQRHREKEALKKLRRREEKAEERDADLHKKLQAIHECRVELDMKEQELALAVAQQQHSEEDGDSAQATRETLEREITERKVQLHQLEFALQFARDHWKVQLSTSDNQLTREEESVLLGLKASQVLKDSHRAPTEADHARERNKRRVEYARIQEEEIRLAHKRKQALLQENDGEMKAKDRSHRTLDATAAALSKTRSDSSYVAMTLRNKAMLQRRHDAANQLRRPPTPEVSGLIGFGDGRTHRSAVTSMVREPQLSSPLGNAPHAGAFSSSSALLALTGTSRQSTSVPEEELALTSTQSTGPAVDPYTRSLSLNEKAVLSMASLRQVQARKALDEAERLTRPPELTKSFTQRQSSTCGGSATSSPVQQGYPQQTFPSERHRLEVRAVTFNNWALLYKQSHQVVQALQAIEVCMSIEEELGVLSGRTLLNLANILRLVGCREDALLTARKAMQLLSAAGDEAGIAELESEGFDLHRVAFDTLAFSHQEYNSRPSSTSTVSRRAVSVSLSEPSAIPPSLSRPTTTGRSTGTGSVAPRTRPQSAALTHSGGVAGSVTGQRPKNKRPTSAF